MNPHGSLFSQHPLTQLAVAFSAGVCAANYLSLRLGIALLVGALCSALAVGLVLKRRVQAAALMLLLAMFFAGVALAVLERRRDESGELKNFVDKSVTLTGVLDGPPEFARDRLYITLCVERIDTEAIANGRVSLLAPFRNAATAEGYRALQLRYGARVTVRTTLDRTGNYRNPGVSPLSEYLERRGYDATGIVRGPGSIARLDDTRVFLPLAKLYDWRERFQREIDTRFAPETAGVLDAALLGNRYNLSQSASERFREGGTFHVLVISGFTSASSAGSCCLRCVA